MCLWAHAGFTEKNFFLVYMKKAFDCMNMKEDESALHKCNNHTCIFQFPALYAKYTWMMREVKIATMMVKNWERARHSLHSYVEREEIICTFLHSISDIYLGTYATM